MPSAGCCCIGYASDAVSTLTVPVVQAPFGQSTILFLVAESRHDGFLRESLLLHRRTRRRIAPQAIRTACFAREGL